ncbi:MAG: hypothetical protein JXQ72_03950 [Anaerolineae bacterium]|nr:hypothetical protein [Anaerolineae bacterium]
MKITCPHCGAAIPAANVNIQEMVALCSDCNDIFALDRDKFTRKPKRVISKRPPRVRLHTQDDDDHLALSYRMALGPGPKIGLFASSMGSVVLAMMLVGMRADGAPQGPILFVGLLLLFTLYMLAMIITTTTHISADDEVLEIATGPLPFPVSDDKILNLDEIRRIYAGQTVEAFSGGVPANNVYAEMNDSRRVPIVTSLPYDYAHYLALLLEDYLHAGVEAHELDITRFDDALDAESGLDNERLVAALDGELSSPQQRTNSR